VDGSLQGQCEKPWDLLCPEQLERLQRNSRSISRSRSRSLQGQLFEWVVLAGERKHPHRLLAVEISPSYFQKKLKLLWYWMYCFVQYYIFV